MPVLETISGFRTAPGAALGVVTMATNDSNVVRAFPSAPLGFGKLLNIWGYNQVNGNIRLRSPNFNDLSNGINVVNVASQIYPLMPIGQFQNLTSQDPLIIENSGSAVAGQIEIMAALMYYNFGANGPNARLVDERYVDTYAAGNITTVQQTIVCGVGGGWSGSQALNAAMSGVTLKPNTDYAWLGSMCQDALGAIGLRGPDSANFRMACPGNNANKDQNREWWLYLTRLHGLPLIPIFNTAGLGQIFCEVLNNQAALTTQVTHWFQQLNPGGA